MGFKDTAKSVAAKLRLDKHHTAERLALNTVVLAAAGALVLTGAGAASYSANQGTLGSKAVYTEAFVSSKSQTQGTVLDVYRSEDGKRSLVMMQFADPTQVSADAETYQAFVTGADPNMSQESIATPGVSGQIISFGATGYMGIMLDSAEPFQTQILNLVVRSNDELVYTPGPAELQEDMQDDGSFADFDQWRMYYNPGATKAKHLPALDQRSPDMGSLFYETVAKGQEAAVRDKLDGKLMEMRVALNRIQSEQDKLATTAGGQLYLREPAVPTQIDGDKVTGEPGTRQAQEAKDEAAQASSKELQTTESMTPGERLVAEQEQVGTGDDSTLELEAQSVVPGGYEFDWRDGSISDGYVEELAQDGENLVQVIQRHADEAAEGSLLDTNDVKWILSDGKDLTEDYNAAKDSALKPLVAIMNGLTQAWNDYYGLKQEYQITLPSELINLEMELRSAQTASTVHAGEEVVIAY